jgi:uncharacterized coiled-coil protein SlyX
MLRMILVAMFMLAAAPIYAADTPSTPPAAGPASPAEWASVAELIAKEVIKPTDERLARLVEQVGTLDARNRSFSAALSELQDHNKAREQAIDALRAEVAQLKAQLEAMQRTAAAQPAAAAVPPTVTQPAARPATAQPAVRPAARAPAQPARTVAVTRQPPPESGMGVYAGGGIAGQGRQAPLAELDIRRQIQGQRVQRLGLAIPAQRPPN